MTEVGVETAEPMAKKKVGAGTEVEEQENMWAEDMETIAIPEGTPGRLVERVGRVNGRRTESKKRVERVGDQRKGPN